MSRFNDLDPLLHQQLRLAIMALLMSVEEARFTFIREKINTTAGNLSIQIKKLNEAGYISVKKQFRNNYPLTTCKVTTKGIKAFENYVNSLKGYINFPDSQSNS